MDTVQHSEGTSNDDMMCRRVAAIAEHFVEDSVVTLDQLVIAFVRSDQRATNRVSDRRLLAEILVRVRAETIENHTHEDYKRRYKLRLRSNGPMSFCEGVEPTLLETARYDEEESVRFVVVDREQAIGVPDDEASPCRVNKTVVVLVVDGHGGYYGKCAVPCTFVPGRCVPKD